MSGSPSGAYFFDPSYSELMIDAFERCGLRTNALTIEHITSARRSMNLVNAKWSNRGINLWKVDLVTQLMAQGQGQYPVDTNVIDVLDTYLRQYNLGQAISVPVAFSTTASSPLVTIYQTEYAEGSGPNYAGAYVAIVVPVSVGGIVLQGYYQVQSVPGVNQYTIKAASNATSTVSNGGQVPVFTTTQNSQAVAVNLPAHGLVAGSQFQVQATTQIGGLILSGFYLVASVTDANNFTITSSFPAGFAQTLAENGGEAQIAAQASLQPYSQAADPVDILLFPLSRNDYAAIPDKAQQGRPTSYWFNRTPPLQSMNIWLVPDAAGPYEMRYYVFRRIQDASPSMGQTPDMPYRFLEAYTAGLAEHLSFKWAPDRTQGLMTYATQMWSEAAQEDREKVPLFFSADMSSYFRG